MVLASMLYNGSYVIAHVLVGQFVEFLAGNCASILSESLMPFVFGALAASGRYPGVWDGHR